MLEISDITGHSMRDIVALYIEREGAQSILDFVESLMKERADYVNKKLREFRIKQGDAGG